MAPYPRTPVPRTSDKIARPPAAASISEIISSCPVPYLDDDGDSKDISGRWGKRPFAGGHPEVMPCVWDAWLCGTWVDKCFLRQASFTSFLSAQSYYRAPRSASEGFAAQVICDCSARRGTTMPEVGWWRGRGALGHQCRASRKPLRTRTAAICEACEACDYCDYCECEACK